MRWQPFLLVLGLLALSLVDLSTLVGAGNGAALDVAIALAVSQAGLAAVWLAWGRTSLVLRLAGTGLVVNAWCTALPQLATSLVGLLLGEIAGVVCLGAGLRAAGCDLQGAATGASKPAPRQWSLAETLAIAAIAAAAIGPARALGAEESRTSLVLLGALFAARTVGLAWATLGPLKSIEGALAAMLASGGTLAAIMLMHDTDFSGLAPISLASAAMTVAALAVVRVCGYRVVFEPAGAAGSGAMNDEG